MQINLLFGFLGSGKTTLVRHLLGQRVDGRKTAVIVNEFGEVGVDGDILRGNNVDMVELNSGCLCCTLRGSLLLAVEELRERSKVERIIVEATGIAEPGELTQTLADPSLQQTLEIGPLVTVVDAAKFPKLIAMLGEFYAGQIENADIVILNKADLATPAELDEVAAHVRELNPEADILFAEQCDVDAGYLFDRRPGGLLERTRAASGKGNGQAHGASAADGQADDAAHSAERHGGQPDDHAHGAHDHDHDAPGAHPAHAGAPAESFVLAAGANPPRAAVERFFAGLPDAVWRAKGFMRIGGEPSLVQYTMGQLEITPASVRPHENIVFIGRDMNRPGITARFAALAKA